MLTGGTENVVDSLKVIGHGSQVDLKAPEDYMTKRALAQKGLVSNEALSMGWIRIFWQWTSKVI